MWIQVLVATGVQGMLEKLVDSNGLLDKINKGLNAYLEKKRLFFPRCVHLVKRFGDSSCGTVDQMRYMDWNWVCRLACLADACTGGCACRVVSRATGVVTMLDHA